MPPLLNQALFLTLIGMTMTFAAIGLLVIGMYALTALARDERPKKRKPVVVTVERDLQSEATAKQISLAVFPNITLTPEKTPNNDQNDVVDEAENRRRAAATAVAMALAMQVTATTTATGAVAGDNWNTFVRGHHLAQRQRYAAQRSVN